MLPRECSALCAPVRMRHHCGIRAWPLAAPRQLSLGRRGHGCPRLFLEGSREGPSSGLHQVQDQTGRPKAQRKPSMYPTRASGTCCPIPAGALGAAYLACVGMPLPAQHPGAALLPCKWIPHCQELLTAAGAGRAASGMWEGSCPAHRSELLPRPRVHLWNCVLLCGRGHGCIWKQSFLTTSSDPHLSTSQRAEPAWYGHRPHPQHPAPSQFCCPCRLKVEELEGERSRLEAEKKELELLLERRNLQVSAAHSRPAAAGRPSRTHGVPIPGP